MAHVPVRVSEIIAGGYEVKPGDTVGSISAGMVGDAMAYRELVGANLHKPLIDHGSLPHKVFASLAVGEKLNVPASWAGPGQVGSSGAVGQASDVLGQILNMTSGTALVAMTGLQNLGLPTNTAAASQVLANWWPYLQVPPNGYSLPPFDPQSLLNWITNYNGVAIVPVTQNLTLLQNLAQAAQRYYDAAGSWQYLPWDHVPWEDLSQKWPALIAALGNNPTALTELAKFAADVAMIPANPGNYSLSQLQQPMKPFSLQPKQYAPPNFVQTDWTSNGYPALLKWLTSPSFDPAAVPWDLLLSDRVRGCIAAHPNRLKLIYDDAACFKNLPAGVDPMEKFVESLCADMYAPGWCNITTTSPPKPPAAETAEKKSNVGLWIAGGLLVVGLIGVGIAVSGPSPRAGGARSNPARRERTTWDGYVKRYIGDAVIRIKYRDEGDYIGHIDAGGHGWSFADLRPPAAGFGPGIAYDSPRAYDKMASSAVGFGAYFTTHNRGDDVPDWAPEPEVADAIDEATSYAMDDRGNYRVSRPKNKRR